MSTEQNFHSRPPLGLPTGSVWEDIKAVTVLLIVAATAILHFLGGPEVMPNWLQNATVGCCSTLDHAEVTAVDT